MIDVEKRKYEKVWSNQEYRNSPSPGDVLLKRLPVLNWIDSHEVKSVLDVGCGEGKLLSKIKWHNPNIEVAGMDIAENAIDFRLKDIFRYGCAWVEDGYTQHDAIFCTDVLEHIPEEKIPTVFDLFKKNANRFCFVTICLKDDIFGKRLIGEQLHLTVKDVYWWVDQFRRLFKIEFMMATDTTLDALLK